MTEDDQPRPGNDASSADVGFRGNFPSELSSIVAIRRAVEQVAGECGATAQSLHNIRLATSEAATNALLHGNSDGARSEIMVRARYDGQQLHVVIADHGDGIMAPGHSRGLGLGMKIIDKMTDRMEMVTGGEDWATEMHMYFSCP